MTVKVIHRKNDMYDCYDAASGKWLFSRRSPDNVFAQLSRMPCTGIKFEDDNLSGFDAVGNNKI